MKRLSKEQMKRVNGGSTAMTCSATCPPGQSAGCAGYDSCSATGDGGPYDTGLDCTSGGITKHFPCASGPAVPQ